MDAYVGEIRLLPYTFAPYEWFWCEGQVLQANQYPALYSLLGNVYGGNQAQSTFALPDLRGAAAVGATMTGSGPAGLTPYRLGQRTGSTEATAPLAAHTHVPKSGFASGASPIPTATATSVIGETWLNNDFIKPPMANPVPMAAQSLTGTFDPKLGNTQGSASAHSNVQPYLTVMFAICWQGIYPDYS